MEPLQTGMRVRDAKHSAVGVVTGVRAWGFEVGERLGGGASVWLANQAVQNVDPAGVSLVCNGEDLARYVSPAPTE